LFAGNTTPTISSALSSSPASLSFSNDFEIGSNQMLDVASRSSKKVIDAQDDCPVPQQTLTQVRTEKTSTTGNQYASF
jgi:hypothetical protein